MIDLASKRIFVTGGRGFVGRRLVAELAALGCRQIFAPDERECDLLDGAAVDRALAEHRPELVIHLAARVGGIGANRAHPAEYFYDNLMMGVPLMHKSWKAGVGKFVAIGTVCAYPKFTPVPFREDDLWNGYPEETNAPYGLAKKMMLVQAQAYRLQYGFNAVFLLPVNMYGPGDNFDLESSHVIPALIRKFVEAKDAKSPEVVCWGDGSASREFMYVDDSVSGILAAAERYDGELPVNLGSGHEIAIRDLAPLVAKIVGYSGRIVWDTARPNGQPRRCLDTSRARELFGWEAKVGLEQGLRETVEWYLKNRV